MLPGVVLSVRVAHALCAGCVFFGLFFGAGCGGFVLCLFLFFKWKFGMFICWGALGSYLPGFLCIFLFGLQRAFTFWGLATF